MRNLAKKDSPISASTSPSRALSDARRGTFSTALESVGGDLNAYTNKEGTVYYSAILEGAHRQGQWICFPTSCSTPSIRKRKSTRRWR